MVEIAVWALIGLGTVTWFDLQINWDKGTVSSKTGVVGSQCVDCLLRVYLPLV